MSSQVASLTSFLKKSMKQKEVLTYQQKKFNKGNKKSNQYKFPIIRKISQEEFKRMSQ